MNTPVAVKAMDIKSAFERAQSRKRKSDHDEINSGTQKTLKKSFNDECLKVVKDVDNQPGEVTVTNLENHPDPSSKVVNGDTTKSIDCESNIVKVSSNKTANSVKDVVVLCSSDSEEVNSSEQNSILIDSKEEFNASEQNSILIDSKDGSSPEPSGNLSVNHINNVQQDERTKSVSVAGPSSSKVPVSNVLRKRKKMSPAEAKKKSELRLQREKEREQKQLEIQAKLEEKKLEKMKKEEERKHAKWEKQMKKEQAEKEKERLRLEKKDQEEKERMQKEERIKLRQKIQEAKAEEKKRKEEQKKKLLEEKLKALEEKKKLEEEKLKLEKEKEKKKEKTKQAFESFFLKSSSSSGSTSPPQAQGKESVFLPFQVTEDMVLAPVVPIVAKKRFDREQLDNFLNNQGAEKLYLEILKSPDYECVQFKKKKEEKKLIVENPSAVITDIEVAQFSARAKLIQFHENVRPAYWGTWRKKSQALGPRKPFGKDDVFDYEVDSDDEWDEGGPGESLSGTDNDEESEDDYEVDNEFFVPHGYLSAEEEGDEENVPVDPDLQKARLKMKEREFLSEHNKKTTALQPVLLGCFFYAQAIEDEPILEKTFQLYDIDVLTTKEIMTSLQVGDALNISTAASPSCEFSLQRSSKNQRRSVPEEAMPYLIRLLHANTRSRQIVIKEFQRFWHEFCQKEERLNNSECETPAQTDFLQVSAHSPNTTATPRLSINDSSYVSKRQLDLIINSIATWCKPSHPNIKKLCWWVRDEILLKYGLSDIPVPNEWNYSSSNDNEDHLSALLSTPKTPISHPL